MSFPNVSDILATTIENRSKNLADNVTNNNAVLKRMEQKGRTKPVSGGSVIYQELTYAENVNGGWYSGYDLLPVGAADVISAAQFDFKQAAVPVVISGLEMLKNSGKEAFIDLMESRLEVAEATMQNILVDGVYSDGATPTTKQIDGLDAILSTTPSSGTYGGIARGTWSFWRNYYSTTTALLGAAASSSNVQQAFNRVWANLVRGSDRPDLILVDNTMWNYYVNSLQVLQRFTGADVGQLGFPSVKFMDADVVLDGGIYSGSVSGATGVASNTALFLNTKYLHYRPHSQRNMVPLSPNRRYATNQDAEVQIIGWAGNMTCSGLKFQGRLSGA